MPDNDGYGTHPLFPPTEAKISLNEQSLLELIRREAHAARAAVPLLEDEAVRETLIVAAGRLLDERHRILKANAADVAAAAEHLDGGSRDRLLLNLERLEEMGEQLRELAMLPPLERETEARTLDNGLAVSVRRIPIGVVGANFEARPNVAVDIAAQLLKSLNACVLRTGAAALRTVTVLVDDVLRPSLLDAGLPASTVGLVRTTERAGAFALVSLPREVPLVILRGSGATTAALTQVAAANGVRTLRARALLVASLDRLGVCNRLNLLLVHQGIATSLPSLIELLKENGIGVRATERACASTPMLPLDRSLRHEWASEPARIATVTVDMVASLAEAVAIANEETSGLAAGIVTENAPAAAEFLDTYRGTAAFWHAPTRFTDGFALTGAPETGINVEWAPGPRGPVTYRDLWLRQLRVIGDGTQHR